MKCHNCDEYKKLADKMAKLDRENTKLYKFVLEAERIQCMHCSLDLEAEDLLKELED